MVTSNCNYLWFKESSPSYFFCIKYFLYIHIFLIKPLLWLLKLRCKYGYFILLLLYLYVWHVTIVFWYTLCMCKLLYLTIYISCTIICIIYHEFTFIQTNYGLIDSMATNWFYFHFEVTKFVYFVPIGLEQRIHSLKLITIEVFRYIIVWDEYTKHSLKEIHNIGKSPFHE